MARRHSERAHAVPQGCTFSFTIQQWPSGQRSTQLTTSCSFMPETTTSDITKNRVQNTQQCRTHSKLRRTTKIQILDTETVKKRYYPHCYQHTCVSRRSATHRLKIGRRRRRHQLGVIASPKCCPTFTRTPPGDLRPRLNYREGFSPFSTR